MKARIVVFGVGGAGGNAICAFRGIVSRDFSAS
jgi:cell division GTPase FtsZ